MCVYFLYFGECARMRLCVREQKLEGERCGDMGVEKVGVGPLR